MTITTFTSQGSQSKENWDHILISSRKSETLIMLLDGATTSPNGGQFVKVLASIVEQKFQDADIEELEFKNIKETILRILKDAQQQLRFEFISDFSSYAIGIIKENIAIIFHAGDCMVEIYSKNGFKSAFLNWSKRIHCYSNHLTSLNMEELKRCPNRHTLTKRFTSRRFTAPDISVFGLKYGQQLVLSTDGFWAEVDEKTQRQLLHDSSSSTASLSSDDASFIAIKID
jgi:serine/threonine protein phosphatase PrpC